MGFVERGEITLRQQIAIALRDRSYWMLHIGFFTCGVHIAFLVTHLPGEIALCGLSPSVSAVSIALIGLFNVAGSLVAGALGQRMRMKWILAAMYASRAVMIALYLMAPPTPVTFYVFAAALGFTWLATVPPTAGLVGKLYGPRYLGTLFGLGAILQPALLRTPLDPELLELDDDREKQFKANRSLRDVEPSALLLKDRYQSTTRG